MFENIVSSPFNQSLIKFQHSVFTCKWFAHVYIWLSIRLTGHINLIASTLHLTLNDNNMSCFLWRSWVTLIWMLLLTSYLFTHYHWYRDLDNHVIGGLQPSTCDFHTSLKTYWPRKIYQNYSDLSISANEYIAQ